jgi:hypothetical protein
VQAYVLNNGGAPERCVKRECERRTRGGCAGLLLNPRRLLCHARSTTEGCCCDGLTRVYEAINNNVCLLFRCGWHRVGLKTVRKTGRTSPVFLLTRRGPRPKLSREPRPSFRALFLYELPLLRTNLRRRRRQRRRRLTLLLSRWAGVSNSPGSFCPLGFREWDRT